MTRRAFSTQRVITTCVAAAFAGSMLVAAPAMAEGDESAPPTTEAPAPEPAPEPADESGETGEVDGATVAVGAPPVPPASGVAVGAPPVPPTNEAAVAAPPVPPTNHAAVAAPPRPVAESASAGAAPAKRVATKAPSALAAAAASALDLF